MCGEDICTTRPAERKKDDVVVLPDEVLKNCAPLLRAFHVTCSLAREHQRAADVSERLQAGGFAARGRGHRLVELCEALVDFSRTYARESQLGERTKLQVGIAGCERGIERRLCPTPRTKRPYSRAPRALSRPSRIRSKP
jgi:hypothetical protein